MTEPPRHPGSPVYIDLYPAISFLIIQYLISPQIKSVGMPALPPCLPLTQTLSSDRQAPGSLPLLSGFPDLGRCHLPRPIQVSQLQSSPLGITVFLTWSHPGDQHIAFKTCHSYTDTKDKYVLISSQNCPLLLSPDFYCSQF